MTSSERRLSRGGLALLLAAGAALVIIIGVLAAGGDDGDTESVAAKSTPESSVQAVTSAPYLSRDDDIASSDAGSTTSPSESTETSTSAELSPDSDATTIIPLDARFRRPITVMATGDAVPADFENAEAADDSSPPTHLESVDEVTTSDRLNFLISSCERNPDDAPCARGYWFIDPSDADPDDVWPANRPFHIRHGFVNEIDEPLGPGFDLAVYIFSEVDEPNEPYSIGPTKRYTTDYIVRGQSDACGPNHATQDAFVTCEWFVHELPAGLPAGRWVIWAVWEAPCWAWEDLGITECADPDEVISLFSSGGSGPWT